jgi:protein disulfide-isomerase
MSGGFELKIPGILAAALAAFALAAQAAADRPYDEHANPRADIRRALDAAGKAHVPVLVVFGANWCGDCRMLDATMKHGPSAPLIAREFQVVKVDVGKFDHNVDVAEGYHVPLKEGIPAVAVLSPEGKVLYATRAGELADARKMGEDGVYAFFRDVVAKRR